MKELANFSYLVEDKIAGSAFPGRGAELAHNLGELREEGFRAILTVLERPLDEPLMREFDMASLHLPVRDYAAPTLAQMDEAVEFIRRHTRGDSRVLVHCLMGYGRTGTILACHLVAGGRSVQGAIDEVRRLRPGSIEDPSQERAISNYADYILNRRPTQSPPGGNPPPAEGAPPRK